MSFRATQQRLERYSVDELRAMEREAKANAEPGEGIYRYDKRTRQKLDALHWALVYKGFYPMPMSEGGRRAGRQP